MVKALSKHRKKIIIMTILLTLSVLIGVGVARATASLAEISSDQTHNGLYMRSAQTVSIRGTVEGDVVVAATNLEIEGTVNGSIYAVAERVKIGGTVRGNVHVAGSDVEYSAIESGSVFLAGSTVSLSDQARLRNLFAAGSQVLARGKISQNIYAVGSDVVISSKVGSDVAVAGEKIVVSGAATVGGDLTYASNTPATIENDRSIQGAIKRTNPSEQVTTSDRIRAHLIDTAYWLAANILIAAVLLYFAPRLFVDSEKAFLKRPLGSYLKAVVFVVFVPVALVLGLFTFVGIPLVLILGLVYVLILVISPTASALVVGNYSMKRLQNGPAKKTLQPYTDRLLATALGFLLLAIVGLVPMIGGLVSVAAFFLGVAVLLSRNLEPLGHSIKPNKS